MFIQSLILIDKCRFNPLEPIISNLVLFMFLLNKIYCRLPLNILNCASLYSYSLEIVKT